MSEWERAEESRRRLIVRAKMEEDDAREPFVYDPRLDRRHRKGRYPHSGNSETIMRNRVLRAQSFGLYHDGIYER